ncbi:MAG: T9SS type A sorting domain-containing protein, partial [Candidatus Marinimicrobia bacterium]|nr:T9SS type A sorting domain-containing protein [Candidatus Neomarinimicrobiota bacterium]
EGDPALGTDSDGTVADMGAYYYDYPPLAPSLTLSGNIGDSPVLSWTPRDNQLISHSVMEKTYITPSGTNIEIVDPVQSPYTDPLMTLGFGRTKVNYEVKDVDLLDQESPWSNKVVARGEGGEFNKKELIPAEYALHAAYPNPFNPITTIRFDLPERSRVSMIIYDVLGRTINTLIQHTMEPGFKEIQWDGKDDKGNPVSTGMYIYRFSAFSEESEKQFNKSNKLVLMK